MVVAIITRSVISSSEQFSAVHVEMLTIFLLQLARAPAMFAFHRAANFDKIYLIASDFKCLKHHVRCDHTHKINLIQLYFWTQSQFQGLCCLKLLFACNTQLQRVVMYFEIRWIEGKHAWGSARPYFMPNSKQYSSCFANAPASNKH